MGHPESYESPLQLFRIWEGGLTLYGGLVAAIIVSFLYLARHKIRFFSVADAVSPALALGEAITRIGCFLNGCCFGRPCEGSLCVHYPLDSYAVDALGNLGIYPSQLFLSAAMFLFFLLLWRLDRRALPVGVLFGIYLVGQGIFRYAVDFTRYYETVDQVHSLGPWIETKSQIVALCLTAFGVVILVLCNRSRGRAQLEEDQ